MVEPGLVAPPLGASAIFADILPVGWRVSMLPMVDFRAFVFLLISPAGPEQVFYDFAVELARLRGRSDEEIASLLKHQMLLCLVPALAEYWRRIDACTMA